MFQMNAHSSQMLKHWVYSNRWPEKINTNHIPINMSVILKKCPQILSKIGEKKTYYMDFSGYQENHTHPIFSEPDKLNKIGEWDSSSGNLTITDPLFLENLMD